MISCCNLSYGFNGNRLISSLSFTLLPGCVLQITGANGIGKTTLLKILAGYLEPDSGEISYSNLEGEKACADETFFIPQENLLFSELDVFQTLEFYADLNDNKELLLMAIKYFKLEELLERKCRFLSSGEARKVSFAKLLLNNKQIWLLDEPENFLDEEAREMINNLVFTKASRGGIIVSATHIANHKNVNILNLNDYRNEANI